MKIKDIWDKSDKPFMIERNKDFNRIKGILSKKEVDYLLKCEKKGPIIPTGIDGIARNYKKSEKIHLYRSIFYSEKFADILFNRLKIHLDENAVGINSAFRIINYSQEGYLIPHYDLPYKEGNKISRMSLVLYLTNNDGKIKEHRVNHHLIKYIDQPLYY